LHADQNPNRAFDVTKLCVSPLLQGQVTPVHGTAGNLSQQQQLEAELDRVQAHAEQLTAER
jgi:hypothetical protein